MTERGTHLLRYRPEIDGLRAIAVSAVVLHHVWPDTVTGGYIGVDVFFVISGYLITSIIAGQMQAGTFSFASFYARRARRLLPSLLVMLFAVMLAGWFIFLPSDYLATFHASLATTLFASNFEFWRILAQGYFAPDSKLNPLLHTWSLGVEEQFYLVFPLLLLACMKLAPRRLVQIVLVAMVLSFGASVALIAKHSVAVFFLTPFRAWELFVGVALAIGMVPTVRSAGNRLLVGFGGLAAILTAALVFTPTTPFPGWAALLPVVGSAAIIHATGVSNQDALTGLLSLPLVVYLGRISYSLYLWHWPLVVFVKYAFQAENGLWTGCILVGVSVGLAALSYRFVESLFRYRSHATSDRVFIIKAFAWSAAISCISVWGVTSGGFRQRVPPQALRFDKERRASLPFRQCDQKLSWCVLGDKRNPPDILFWGDSHMLAWAPAIDQELRARGRSGYLAVHSACPPAPGIVWAGPDCLNFDREVAAFVFRTSGVRRIVIAANWNSYVLSGRIGASGAATPSPDSASELTASLRGAIRQLRRNGRTVVLVGPVPTYSRDVPFELARSVAGFPLGGLVEPKPDLLGAALRRVAEQSGSVYVDVKRAMCHDNRCELSRRGRSLYRDDQHLSVSGALQFEALMAEVIGPPRPE